jgi:hypothetical protein
MIGLSLRHSILESIAVQGPKNEAPCAVGVKRLTLTTMPYTSVIGETAKYRYRDPSRTNKSSDSEPTIKREHCSTTIGRPGLYLAENKQNDSPHNAT